MIAKLESELKPETKPKPTFKQFKDLSTDITDALLGLRRGSMAPERVAHLDKAYVATTRVSVLGAEDPNFATEYALAEKHFNAYLGIA